MLDSDDRSHELFGRYQALRVYVAIARMPKPEFATGEVVALSGVTTDAASKELKKLRALEVIRGQGRRGDYQRVDDTRFWELMEALGEEWGI